MGDAGLHVALEPVVGGVDDLVHRERGDAPGGIGGAGGGELGLDAGQPAVQRVGRAGVQRREGADHPGEAFGDDQLRPRQDEHGRGDHRQRQRAAEGGGKAFG